MSKHLKTISAILFIACIGFLSSCTYDWIEYPEPPPIDTTVPISFSGQIEPIFNNSNYCTSCHKTGGTSPNLETGKAYNSLTNLGLIDITTPTSSVIYYYPEPSSEYHSWKKYTAGDAQLVLTWIQQGAKNN